MKTQITKGLEKDAADEISKAFKSSGRLRKQLIAVMEGKGEGVRKARLSDNDYASPSWAMQQADAVGYQRAIVEIISLLSD